MSRSDNYQIREENGSVRRNLILMTFSVNGWLLRIRIGIVFCTETNLICVREFLFGPNAASISEDITELNWA